MDLEAQIGAVLSVGLDAPDSELRAALVKLEALCAPESLARLPRKRRKRVRYHAMLSLRVLRMSVQARDSGHLREG